MGFGHAGNWYTEDILELTVATHALSLQCVQVHVQNPRNAHVTTHAKCASPPTALHVTTDFKKNRIANSLQQLCVLTSRFASVDDWFVTGLAEP